MSGCANSSSFAFCFCFLTCNHVWQRILQIKTLCWCQKVRSIIYGYYCRWFCNLKQWHLIAHIHFILVVIICKELTEVGVLGGLSTQIVNYVLVTGNNSHCLVCPVSKQRRGLSWLFGKNDVILFRDDIPRYSSNYEFPPQINDPNCNNSNYSLKITVSHLNETTGLYTCRRKQTNIAKFCVRLAGKTAHL